MENLELNIEGRVIYINNERCIIRKRKKGKDKKPDFYIFNIQNKKYVSSLYETYNKKVYIFDIRLDNGKKERYLIKFYNDSYEIRKQWGKLRV